MKKKIIPIILSGGFGKRLWPLSSENKPKQFLKLPQNSKYSLFQKTLLRMKSSFFNKPMIICSEKHKFIILEQLLEINIEPLEILTEPISKNTAASICLAVYLSLHKYKAHNVLVSPCDHHMEQKNIEKNFNFDANEPKNFHIVFGVKPSSPNTNYGYIEIKNKKFNQKLLDVKSFHEKPQIKIAKKLYKNNNFFWNSGIFFLNCKFTISEFKTYNPKILSSCEKSIQNANYDMSFLKIQKKYFERCPSNSFDIAILEKSSNIKMNEISSKWDDLGSWKSLFEINKNKISKKSILTKNMKNSDVLVDKKYTLINDIEDLIIVSQNDSLLVSSKRKINDIKDIISKKNNFFENNNEFYRPWGKYEVIEETKNYLIKKLTIKPGFRISLQKHIHRSEHWIVLKGIAKVTNNKSIFHLKENESTFIPQGTIHCLENENPADLIIIEIQIGKILSENDIIRLEDPYNREK